MSWPSAPFCRVHLAEIDGQLVGQDQGGPALEERRDGLGAGGDPLLVAGPHPVEPGRPGERVGDLAPGGLRGNAFGQVAAVRGVGGLPGEGGDPDRTGRAEGRVEEFGGDGLRGPRRVRQRDEPVGLPAAEGGVQPEDGDGLPAGAAQPPADMLQEALQAPGGVRVTEEAGGLPVVGGSVLAEHRSQVRGEVGLGDPAAQHLLPRLAEVENSGFFKGLRGFDRVFGRSGGGRRASSSISAVAESFSTTYNVE